MKSTLLHASVLLATAVSAAAAFNAGDTAFTKRVETALLSEPRVTAKAVAQQPYARELKVQGVQGAWVNVSAGRQRGWIFAGNLAESKPSETRGLDGLPLPASETSATAAARPLAVATVDYTDRKGLGKAAEDIEWLQAEAKKVSAGDVVVYLQEQKKGEYQ